MYVKNPVGVGEAVFLLDRSGGKTAETSENAALPQIWMEMSGYSILW